MRIDGRRIADRWKSPPSLEATADSRPLPDKMPACGSYGSLVEMVVKISFTFTPAAVTPAIATIAISATSSAYSNKSCPSSSRRNALWHTHDANEI